MNKEEMKLWLTNRPKDHRFIRGNIEARLYRPEYLAPNRYLSDGSMTYDEWVVASYWPRPLLRQSRGCDFRDGTQPIEVKRCDSSSLTISQFNEFFSENNGKLVVVNDSRLLIFDLEQSISLMGA